MSSCPLLRAPPFLSFHILFPTNKGQRNPLKAILKPIPLLLSFSSHLATLLLARGVVVVRGLKDEELSDKVSAHQHERQAFFFLSPQY